MGDAGLLGRHCSWGSHWQGHPLAMHLLCQAQQLVRTTVWILEASCVGQCNIWRAMQTVSQRKYYWWAGMQISNTAFEGKAFCFSSYCCFQVHFAQRADSEVDSCRTGLNCAVVWEWISGRLRAVRHILTTWHWKGWLINCHDARSVVIADVFKALHPMWRVVYCHSWSLTHHHHMPSVSCTNHCLQLCNASSFLLAQLVFYLLKDFSQ